MLWPKFEFGMIYSCATSYHRIDYQNQTILHGSPMSILFLKSVKPTFACWSSSNTVVGRAIEKSVSQHRQPPCAIRVTRRSFEHKIQSLGLKFWAGTRMPNLLYDRDNSRDEDLAATLQLLGPLQHGQGGL